MWGARPGLGAAGQAQRPRPAGAEQKPQTAPSLGTVEAVLTCSGFTLSRPEQLAPACRRLQGETPHDAAGRLPPPLPTRNQAGRPLGGRQAGLGGPQPGAEMPHPPLCRPGSSSPGQLASSSWGRRGSSTPPARANGGSDSTWQPHCSDSKTVVWLVGCPGSAQLRTGCWAGGRVTLSGMFLSPRRVEAPGSSAAG